MISREQLELAEREFTLLAESAFRDAKAAEMALADYDYSGRPSPFDPNTRARLLHEYQKADYMAESRALIATLLRETLAKMGAK